MAIDLVMRSEYQVMPCAIPVPKERLQLNVELTSSGQFIPVPPGWEARSPVIIRTGRVSFHHSAITTQALAEIQSGHPLDLDGIEAMPVRGVITRAEVRRQRALLEPQLYRLPAFDPQWCRRAVEAIFPP